MIDSAVFGTAESITDTPKMIANMPDDHIPHPQQAPEAVGDYPR